MDVYGKEAPSVNVGQQLRILREERHISMRALARASGLSANALSMIERSLTSPSVSTLSKLAYALGIPVAAFFYQSQPKQKIVFCKASERSRVPFLRGLWETMGGDHYDGRLEAFLVTIENGGNSGQHNMLHGGHEFVFCLRGSLEIEIDDQRFQLEAGDSVMFAANFKHRWRNSGNNVTNIIIVISGFEENEHPGEFHLASSYAIEDLAEIDEKSEEDIEEA
jgi:transcriptional regulator with XRE-family HTH domain